MVSKKLMQSKVELEASKDGWYVLSLLFSYACYFLPECIEYPSAFYSYIS
jgi:hypothetical protein